MLRQLTLLQALPLLAAASPSVIRNARAENTTGIQWQPCTLPRDNTTSVQFECGTLEVPLDYSDEESEETLKLDIVRGLATKPCSDKKGSIYLNFGGPGFDGVDDLVFYSEPLMATTGGNYDLINVVPRGTGYTMPFSCYTDVLSRTYTSLPLNSDSSDTAAGQGWAQATIWDQNCYNMQNLTGELIGTAFSVRDMFRVVDELEADGMLRYYGVSYGTIMGATAAAMFPDRVDKMVIDGVVNPHEYYANRETELFTNTDDVFSGFCEACVSHPADCAIASNQTAEGLETFLLDLFESIKWQPIAYPIPGSPGGGFVLDYSTLMNYIVRQMYFPFQWPQLAKAINAVLEGDVNELVPILSGGSGGSGGATGSSESLSSTAKRQSGNFIWSPPGAPEALWGIKCSDLHDNSTFEEIDEILEARRNASKFGGIASDLVTRCGQWLMPARERYEGDFNVSTKNPILIVGNTFDPVTPLASARNVSATFEGSVVLQQDSYGHDSLTQASLCTAKAVRSYFRDGTLPEPDTVCDIDIEAFSGSDGWEDVLAQLAEE